MGGIGLVGGGGQGGCKRNVGGRGDVGYKKVLYNIKKMKNVGGGRGMGQYLNPKHSLCI